MEDLKAHIQHIMLWEFKNKKNVKKISCVYDNGVITDCQVGNWFLKFCSSDTSLNPDQDAHQTPIKML